MATPRLGKHFDPRFLCCLGGWNTQNIMRNPMLGILGLGYLVISVRYFPLGAGRWGRNEAASPGRPRPPDPGGGSLPRGEGGSGPAPAPPRDTGPPVRRSIGETGTGRGSGPAWRGPLSLIALQEGPGGEGGAVGPSRKAGERS